MEAIGDQLAEFGGSAGTLPRTGPRTVPRFEAYDDGTQAGFPPRLHGSSLAASAPVAPPGPATSRGIVPDNAGETDISVNPLDLARITGILAALASAAPDPLASAGYVEAAEFAAQVEDVARTVEYLQVLAAGAVDRTRTRAITDAATARASTARAGRGWITGWSPDGTETLNSAAPPNTTVALQETDANWPAPAATLNRPHPPAVTSPADDGCRTTAEFLRLRLRIPIREATRRLALAHQTLPGTTLTGDPIPPTREHLATALTPTRTTTRETGTGDATGTPEAGTGPTPAAPAVSSYAATIITATLDRLQHHTTPETLNLIEHQLTTTAATADPDFLTRVARRWADTINANGTEPTEEALRHTQGAFLRKPRHGLHHIEIFATTDQYEHLTTAMNAATNPRTTTPTTTTTADHTNSPETRTPDAGHDTNTGSTPARNGTNPGNTPAGNNADPDPDLDRRTRPQRQLDGILSAVTAGLTTNQLPTTGGNRPQIIATINYQDLFPTTSTDTHDPATSTSTSTDHSTSTGTGTSRTGTGTFAFTGPVAATTLRKLACDADIIPAVLGTHGEILDLGRKTRLFTPTQRTALTARDQGCAFPNCTAPAPWCEAHHITYWSHGGDTSIDNGVLLCSHHHHLIHKEQWTITVQHGTPTFIPPTHIDPTQKPQQNHYFKPPPPPHPRE